MRLFMDTLSVLIHEHLNLVYTSQFDASCMLDSDEIFQDTCLTAAKGLHIHVYPIAASRRRYYANIHHMGCDKLASL